MQNPLWLPYQNC